MQDLNVALIQADLVWENPKQNRQNFTQKIDTIAKDVDVIILPEMFTTGFTMNPFDVAESMDGETIQWMKETSERKNSAITGSVIIKENNNYYNRLIFVEPEGELTFYDKRHLFTLAGEEKVYTQGEEKLIVNYKGWKICPMICYDLRFPVWSRNTENYDLLIYVANWPQKRIAAWDALLKARAIENMSYSIGVNRVGIDASKFNYIGHSAVYNCLGEHISGAFSGKEKTAILKLNAEHFKKTKEKLQFLNDSDSFTIN